LQAAESNLQIGYLHITITRAYYAMFYAASTLLSARIVRGKHPACYPPSAVFCEDVEPDYSQMLGHAFDSRLDSDYDLTFMARDGGGRYHKCPSIC
jgi:uncharacterized protein (UPF0332 family)